MKNVPKSPVMRTKNSTYRQLAGYLLENQKKVIANIEKKSKYF